MGGDQASYDHQIFGNAEIEMLESNLRILTNSNTMPMTPQEKKYSCSFCNFMSARKYNLESHMRSIHTKEKPYKCDLCSYSASRMFSLKSHQHAHHPEKFADQEDF